MLISYNMLVFIIIFQIINIAGIFILLYELNKAKKEIQDVDQALTQGILIGQSFLFKAIVGDSKDRQEFLKSIYKGLEDLEE